MVWAIRDKKNSAKYVHTRIKQEFETPREGFRTSKPGAARRPASREKTESATRQLPWGPRMGSAAEGSGLLKTCACRRFRGVGLQRRYTWAY
mgnify:CR=1 FL=1